MSSGSHEFDPHNLEAVAVWMRASLEDARLSRNERRVLMDQLGKRELSLEAQAELRRLACMLARESLTETDAQTTVDWLSDVIKTIDRAARGELAGTSSGSRAATVTATAFFSPGEECRRAVIGQLRHARSAIDICVFTITDDMIAREIIEAHRRGVPVRLLTDNDKSQDSGSDIHQLRKAGVPVRVDQSDYHMHHKFALFDRVRLLNGSYNWTRSAARHNEENLVLCSDASLMTAFSELFESLWAKWSDTESA